VFNGKGVIFLAFSLFWRQYVANGPEFAGKARTLAGPPGFAAPPGGG